MSLDLPERLRRWRRLLVLCGSIALAPLVAIGAVGSGKDRVVDVAIPGNTASTIGAVHFGGPDRPAGALARLLLERIDAVPAGGRIDWATYYFRDRDLARALIRASRRGVRVTLCVDGDPRLEGANAAALALLRQDGLNGGLVVRRPLPAPLGAASGKLHLKIYAFSGPQPVALVGSFNPSGDEDTDKATLDEIGDQDRGENLLVELTGAGLVRTLTDHVAAIVRGEGAASRFAMAQNRIWRDRDTDLYFFPRLRPRPVENMIDRLGAGARLWGAVSHLKGGMVAHLADAARRGVGVALVVHQTQRRVPQAAVDRLATAGVSIHRYHAEGLPMHAKFFVVAQGGHSESWFGSLNYNRNSRWLNDEVLVRSGDPALAKLLVARFATIAAAR